MRKGYSSLVNGDSISSALAQHPGHFAFAGRTHSHTSKKGITAIPDRNKSHVEEQTGLCILLREESETTLASCSRSEGGEEEEEVQTCHHPGSDVRLSLARSHSVLTAARLLSSQKAASALRTRPNGRAAAAAASGSPAVGAPQRSGRSWRAAWHSFQRSSTFRLSQSSEPMLRSENPSRLLPHNGSLSSRVVRARRISRRSARRRGMPARFRLACGWGP